MNNNIDITTIIAATQIYLCEYSLFECFLRMYEMGKFETLHNDVINMIFIHVDTGYIKIRLGFKMKK